MIDKAIPARLCFISLQREMMPNINPIIQKPIPQTLTKNEYKKISPISGIHPSNKSKIGAKLKIDATIGITLSFRDHINPNTKPKTIIIEPSIHVKLNIGFLEFD